MKRIKGVIGLMKPMGLMGLIGLIGLIGLMGCSGEDEHRTSQTIDLMNYMPTFYEVEDNEANGPYGPWAITRADWWPSGYVDYSTIYGASGMFKDQENIKDRSIGVFFVKNGTVLEGRFRYAAGQWRSSVELEVGGYDLYGYIPAGGDIVTSTALSPLNSDYANGAVLTLNGLSTVTPNDVCVIVGARHGTKTGDDDPVPVSPFQTGVCHVEIHAGAQGNYIFLLFDHIYSGIRFRFKVNGEYNALRTIKLKRLEMKGYKDDGLTTTVVKSKVNATITLKQNDTNSSPITSVSIVPDETSSDVTTPIYDCGSGSPVVLSTDYSDFLGCFAPNLCNKFALTSTYDVYDTKGNLVRQNCTATNMIDIRDYFPYGMTRGTMYTVRLTVNPTYLYMLSEPDLDNPTIDIN